ncbi:MAG: hypothetical protein ACXW5W_02065 [Candidatus Binatia bacterium]
MVRFSTRGNKFEQIDTAGSNSGRRGQSCAAAQHIAGQNQVKVTPSAMYAGWVKRKTRAPMTMAMSEKRFNAMEEASLAVE